MRITVYLVRHAEAQVNVDPLSSNKTDTLTEKGFLEAQALANYFKQKPIENIFTSKINRAQLTANEIGSAMSIKPVIVESLKERKVSYVNPTEYVHVEDFDSLLLRLVETKSFLENLSHKRIVVVSHALYVRALISFITFGDLLTEELLHCITESFIIENASITKLEYNTDKQRWHVRSFNEKQDFFNH